MVYTLACPFLAVQHNAKSLFSDTQIPSQTIHNIMHVPQQAQVSGRDIQMCRDVLSRHQKNMNRRLGVNIPESVSQFVLIDL